MTRTIYLTREESWVLAGITCLGCFAIICLLMLSGCKDAPEERMDSPAQTRQWAMTERGRTGK